ncbi:hypothetical protein [Novosphingobium sp. AP12]|uniref:hypothetical protein n=1 Tax=Novosphingobium sp. AP12 TaxID=1144305 RepID=UPI0002720F97|nr:hypothetical protein [Novosphingobium sp. AP12]EJL33833.1 hypothetical protein PMI02_00917 [Novosphingobium sp. AP12]
MREVDPFDYWESHSSAIEGLGGLERSPDPRYCFHTRYHEVREGRARFVLELNGVRASFGELSMRVHAWKPESDSNISLVSGARTMLHAEEGADLTVPVHFASQKGVLYALYGYLSEDSDVTAQTLKVAIDEPEDTGEHYPEPPRSILAMDQQAQETRPANALLHYGRVRMEHPVSQSCTYEQIAELGLRARAEGELVISRWSEAACLNALSTYGATYSGLEGLIVGGVAADYAEDLSASTSIVRQADGPPPSRMNADFYDFLLMPAGFETGNEARERWEAVEDWLARLKIGGLAMLGLRYRPDSDLVSSADTSNAQVLSRNEIGQWALRLIGKGYSIAPLAFAPVSDLVVDSQGLAGFVMIVQRL